MDLDRVQLRVLPARAALGAARLFMGILLRRVWTTVSNIADPTVRPSGDLHRSPILVGHPVSPNRPIQTWVNRRHISSLEIGIRCIPGGWSGQSQRQSQRVNLEEVDEVLRRLVESAATEMASRVREVQPLAVVRVLAVGLAIIR